MILSTILTYARAQTLTDSNGLTDTNGIIFANEALQDFHRRLVAHGVDASQVQEAYRDGASGVGTYLYPTNMLFLKAIELNYSDTNQNNYKTASQVDISNLPNGSFSWLRLNADPSSPQFDDHGDWYEIFPTPTSANNISQLIRIFYFLQPTQYTTVSDTVAYPESLDAAILGMKIASSYLFSLKDSGSLDQAKILDAKYDAKIKEYISTLGRGSQQPTQATPIQITGYEF